MAQTVILKDYDVIGFDLDNTLLSYNLSKIFPLQYEFLSNFMVKQKFYNRNFFPPKLTVEDSDFFLRGLFLDFCRGNVLYLRNDGFIIKATHGTTLLSDKAIEDIYGVNRIWSAVISFIDNKLSLWDSSETRTFLDFTDSIVPLIFAKAVDSVDNEKKVSEYNIWPDVLEAVVQMYKPDSSYLQMIGSNLSEFLHPCDDATISWLEELRKHSKLLLITGAEVEVAKITIPYCFGWRHFELFDLIVCDAKKPGFFSGRRPFQNLDGEVTEISLNSNIYRYGNWSDIYNNLRSLFARDIKCMYVGDNPLQDVYAPSKTINKLDTVGIVEELASEELNFNLFDYPHSLYVSSKFWGPLLCNPSGVPTIIGSILKDSAKLVVPSIKFLATKPIDFEFHNTFTW